MSTSPRALPIALFTMAVCAVLAWSEQAAAADPTPAAAPAIPAPTTPPAAPPTPPTAPPTAPPTTPPSGPQAEVTTGAIFVGPPAEATISVGGVVVGPDRPVNLEVGPHSYTVNAPGWCPASGTVMVTAGAVNRVEIAAKDWLFPKVFFSVNRHKIQIVLAGEAIARNSWQTLSGRCGGVVPYKAWLHKQIQTGELALRPGVEVKIDIKLLDPDAVRDLVALGRSQRTGHRAALSYALSIPTVSPHDLSLLSMAEGRWWWNLNFLRLGGGAAFGFGNGYAMEAFGSAVLQITDLGNSKPMHIRGLVTLVPFLGMEMGLGYQNLTNDGGSDRSSFRKPGDSVLTNIGVLRFLGGVTIPINPSVAAELRVAYNVNMAQLLQVGLGVSVALP